MPLMTLKSAAAYRDELHSQGRKLVFTSGCFDLLHVGHVRYLQQARALGDALCIALNADASVRALKGPDRPINSEMDRAEVLLALTGVDAVVIFAAERSTTLIQTIRPHVFAKGGDYTPETLHPEERAALAEIGAEIHILPEVKGQSTTATLAKLAQPVEKCRPRLGVIGSGSGTNCQAVIDAIAAGTLDAEIVLILSDRRDAGILERATQAGLPSQFIDPGHESSLPPAAEQAFCDALRAAGVEIIVLAGFMRVLRGPLLQHYPRRIVNIHPSLLPKYPGKNAIPAALAAGESEAGCTVHYVDDGIDTGEIIAQSSLPVMAGETVESLTRKIQLAEHVLLPVTLQKLLHG